MKHLTPFTWTIDMAKLVGIPIPNEGKGKVEVTKLFKTLYSGDQTNPYHLNKEMLKLYGGETVQNSENIPNR